MCFREEGMSTIDMGCSDLIGKTKKHLRSVLISEKGGVALDRLSGDYRELVGHSLPYKTLGFQSVTALLESFPDVCSLQQRGGTIMVVGRPSEGTAHVLNMVNRQGKKQGRGGGINSLRGEDRQGDGRNGLRGGRNCLRGGRDTWGQSGPHHGATGIVKVTRSAYQQEGGGGTNRIGGKWSSSHGPLCSGSSGNIRETKREAFHVYKEGGINQQRGVSMTAPKSLVGFKELSSVSGSNLSTVPPISKKKPRHQVEASVVEAQPPHVKKNLGSARTLQDSINRSGTVNDFGLQIRAEIRQGLHQTRQNQGTCPGTEMCGQDERLRLLEQRLAKLEQQIVEQKAAEEILLASVERVLAGEEVEEKDLELKLVNLLHHFKRKVQVSEGVASLDVNGNGLTRRNFVSNPLHSDVKQADTSNVARQHPAMFLPRALTLGSGNRGQRGNMKLGSPRHQNAGSPVEKETPQRNIFPRSNMLGAKLSSGSVQSLNCHPRSPDGRMLV